LVNGPTIQTLGSLSTVVEGFTDWLCDEFVEVPGSYWHLLLLHPSISATVE